MKTQDEDIRAVRWYDSIFSAAFVGLAFLSIGGCLADGAIVDRRGALVLVGGGGTPCFVVERAVALAGGPDCEIVILPQASRRATAGDASADMFRKAGAKSVRVVRFANSDNAGKTAILNAENPAIGIAKSQIESADLIWFPGGDQNRLMRRLENAKLVDVIRNRHQAGVVIGGTSAGTAVASELMITGKADLAAIRHGGTELVTGLGLWPGVIVDQHFHKRRRFNRLLSAVLDHPECVGIGIDERTAVVVVGTKCEVIGESSALVIDARSDQLPVPKSRQPARATDIRIDVVVAGDSITVTTP